MHPKVAIRWAVYYRGLAFVSAFCGGTLVFLGLVAGNGWDVSLVIQQPVRALQSASLVPVLVLCGLGVGVWQVGTTAAFYKAMTEAVDEEMATRFDAEMVKSEILSVLDSRLAEMQTELGNTRRAVRELATEESSEFQFNE